MLNLKGYFYTILSAIIFGIMPILTIFAYKCGATAFTLVFLRSFLAIFMILFYLKLKKISIKISRKDFKSLIFLGSVGYASTTLTLFMSYNYISVGLATTLHFIYPMLVSTISILVFKDKLTLNKFAALLLSLIGIFFLQSGQNNLDFRGITLALISGALYSYYIIGISKSNAMHLNLFVLTFYLCIIASIFLLLVGVPFKMIEFKMNIYGFGFSILIAFLTSIVAVIAFQKGIKIIGAPTASILSTFEPVVSIILGIILLNEVLTFKSLLGCILILSSVVIITIHHKFNLKIHKSANSRFIVFKSLKR